MGYPPAGYPPPGYGYPPPRKQSLVWLWITLGVVGAVMVLGILAAVAIPSFMSYQQKAKRSEAELNLNAISKAARRSYAENGMFPTTAAGRTPSEPCCMGPNHRCAPDPAAWAVEPWQSLDFEPYERHYFQYTYTPSADGQGFTVTAIGDLDCDGEEVVFTLTGGASGGNPSVGEIERPTNRD
ncbi:MAG: hypothetical protein IPL61_28725 [Myxococcales bacterium]|nr:hypothetical protein [Myxococcales bacterium]